LNCWPEGEAGRGELCVVEFSSRADIPAALAERLRRRPAGCPRVCYVGTSRWESVGRLVNATGGGAVLLEAGELFNVAPQKWDVAGLK
jgi:hypothetical protein